MIKLSQISTIEELAKKRRQLESALRYSEKDNKKSPSIRVRVFDDPASPCPRFNSWSNEAPGCDIEVPKNLLIHLIQHELLVVDNMLLTYGVEKE